MFYRILSTKTHDYSVTHKRDSYKDIVQIILPSFPRKFQETTVLILLLVNVEITEQKLTQHALTGGIMVML